MNRKLIENLAILADANVISDINYSKDPNKLETTVNFDEHRKFIYFAKLMVAEFVKVSNETADHFESTQPDVAYGIRRNINSVIHHFGEKE